MGVAQAAGGAMPDPSSIERPWLTSYPPGVPPTYRYPDVPLTRFLDDAARDFPEQTATHFDGAELDYVSLRRLVDDLARGLAGLEVTTGTTVAVVLPNLPATVATAFAVWRLGGILVPVDPELPDEEVGRILASANAAVAVVLDEDAERLADMPLPGLHRVIVTRVADWASRRRGTRVLRRLRPTPTLHLPESMTFQVVRFDEVLERGDDVPTAADPDSPALLAFTGGTTGTRRGVVLTHRNLVANAFQARLWVPDVQAGRERLLAATPFSHVFGLTLGMLNGVLSAATLVLPVTVDGPALVAAIEQQRPTLFPTVAALLRMVVDTPAAEKADLTSLRACVSGASPLPRLVAERFTELTGNARVREGYGLSEAGPLALCNPIYGRSEVGRIGLPVTDTVAIVVDPEDPARRLPTGEAGELAIAGPQVMAGYHEDPGATAAVLVDGWLLTGDIVTADSDGSFRLVDRKKDIIVTEASAVFPREVEQVLVRHPAVSEAAVAGRPRGDGADEIVAVAVLHAGAQVSADDLIVHCRHHLPAHAVPAELEIRDSLPTSTLGKVLRRELTSDGPEEAG